MKRIKKIEKFIDENLQSPQIDILQDVTPKVSENRCDHYFKEIEIETNEDDSEDSQVTKRLQNMLDDLRILRRVIISPIYNRIHSYLRVMRVVMQ